MKQSIGHKEGCSNPRCRGNCAVGLSELHDLLCVTVYGGKYTVKQKASGATEALRNGEPWRDCTGDGLILALAQEVEKLRGLVNQARDEYIEANSDGETDCVTPYDIYYT